MVTKLSGVRACVRVFAWLDGNKRYFIFSRHQTLSVCDVWECQSAKAEWAEWVEWGGVRSSYGLTTRTSGTLLEVIKELVSYQVEGFIEALDNCTIVQTVFPFLWWNGNRKVNFIYETSDFKSDIVCGASNFRFSYLPYFKGNCRPLIVIFRNGTLKLTDTHWTLF